VHGAWADGSCWKDVILPLEPQGLFSPHKPSIADFLVLAIRKGQLQTPQLKEMRK
jgi:hypothetical protein